MAGQSKVGKSDAGRHKCSVCGAVLKRLSDHYRSKHTLSTDCLICGEKLTNMSTLLSHVKRQHAHQLGYLLPPTEVVEDMEKLDYPVNVASIETEMKKRGITLSDGEWIKDDEFLVYFDKVNMRPLAVVELLTKTSLEDNYKEERDELPYVVDDELPPTQCPIENMRKCDKDISHIATSANHRQSKEQNDKTFLVRNLVHLYASVNKGILSSVEEHLRQVATNWWKSLLMTILVYPNDTPTPPMQLPRPSHICKVMFLGDHQIQAFIVENKENRAEEPNADEDGREKDPLCNFMAVRADLEEVTELTMVHFKTTLPFSWDVPIWKCDDCREMYDDRVELKLHERYVHKNQLCPVHLKKCQVTFTSFEDYKAHVNSFPRKNCDVEGCGKWFYNGGDLSHHKSRCHTDKTTPCTFPGCEKKFKTQHQLNKHLPTHDNNRARIQCDYCEKSYLTQSKLNEHVKFAHRAASSSSPTRVNTRRHKATVTSSDQADSEQDESLTSQVEALTSQNESLTSQNESLTSQNESLTEENASQKQVIASLQQQLAQLKRARSVPSSVPKRSRRQ